MRAKLALIREALAVTRSQPVATFLTMVIVAGMVASVLLTTGRTVGSEQSVLSSIDSAGTRTIIVRAEPDAGLTTEVLARLENIEGISWAGAFGPAVDVANANVPGARPVAARDLWTDSPNEIGLPTQMAVPERSAWASSSALESLGMLDPSGALVSVFGADLAVVGQIDTPEYLRFLEPLIVVPQARPTSNHAIAILVVIVTRPALVAPIADVLLSVSGVMDPGKITVSTSEGLAELRSLIQRQLGAFGRGMIVLVFALSALLVAVILYGLVTLRRKDFGRRRALGASQQLIVALLLTQVAATALCGVLVGSGISLIMLVATGDPLPGPSFVIGINVLAMAVAVGAAVLPALVAARREPIEELRVP